MISDILKIHHLISVKMTKVPITSDAAFSIFNVKQYLTSVLWHCWLGSRKGIQPLKN